MPPLSIIETLPDDLKAELDRKIRDAKYSDIDATTEWLNARGIDISRSTVARYNKLLKNKDRQSISAAVVKDLNYHSYKSMNAEQLVAELGALRYREVKVLNLLAKISSKQL